MCGRIEECCDNQDWENDLIYKRTNLLIKNAANQRFKIKIILESLKEKKVKVVANIVPI